jgi:ech hydrogenase subunit D
MPHQEKRAMLENVIPITLETLVDETAKIKFSGAKFVTLSCVETDADILDILYHFSKDYELTHFRVNVPKTIPVPSISHIYACAFLAENEIQDLFNAHFTNLSIDFKRTLFLENGIRNGPLCRYSVTDTLPGPAVGDDLRDKAKKQNGKPATHEPGV